MRESREQFISRTADELKRKREEFGLSLAEVGLAVDASRATVGLWERGECVLNGYSAMLLRLLWKRKRAEREQEVLREQARGEASA